MQAGADSQFVYSLRQRTSPIAVLVSGHNYAPTIICNTRLKHVFLAVVENSHQPAILIDVQLGFTTVLAKGVYIANSFFMAALPQALGLFNEFHALIVPHGQEYAENPRAASRVPFRSCVQSNVWVFLTPLCQVNCIIASSWANLMGLGGPWPLPIMGILENAL